MVGQSLPENLLAMNDHDDQEVYYFPCHKTQPTSYVCSMAVAAAFRYEKPYKDTNTCIEIFLKKLEIIGQNNILGE
jgi:hypothetical protein